MPVLSAALLPGVPLIDGPFFDHDAPLLLSDEQMTIARALRENGYAVIDFPDPDIVARMDGIIEDFRGRYDWDGWRAGRLDSLRIQDAWRDDARVKAIATNQSVLDLLSALYGRKAFPFQTLNFPVGTQQAEHSDHAHFNSVPDRFMCGVWLAFEDVDDDNGPLFYYPGSHRWASYQNEHLGVPHTAITPGYPEYSRYVALWSALAEAQGLKREVFKAKKGQALIWTSNLLHGGSRQNDPTRTRWSQVTHYFFEGCAYTTPLSNDVYQGSIVFRTLVDISTGPPVPNMVSGQCIRDNFAAAIKADFNAGNIVIPADLVQRCEPSGRDDAEVEHLTMKLAALARSLAAMQNSKSWRITAPLRAAASLARRIRR